MYRTIEKHTKATYLLLEETSMQNRDLVTKPNAQSDGRYTLNEVNKRR